MALAALVRRVSSLEHWRRRHESFEPTNSTCQVSIANPIDLATATTQIVTFDVEDYDPDDLHAGGGQRITVLVAGVYTVQGGCSWAADDVGIRRIRIYHDAAILCGDVNFPGAISTLNYQAAGRQVRAAVGEYFRLQIYHTNGTKLDCNKAWLGATRIS